jgi:protein phosphatase
MDIKEIKTDFPFEGFAESRVGGRAENQDSWGYADTPYGLLATVCDGMGGGPGGKTASSVAVAELIKNVKEASNEETSSNILIKAIRRANMAIIEMANNNTSLQGMGSTCVALLINEHSAILAYVGDSRIYQFRGRTKMFRTFDHSMVFELVKQKVITEEQARLSAQSNVITRALGIKPDVEVDLYELSYERGDRFLLCTDGIHGAVTEKDLINSATDHKLQLGVVVDTLASKIDNIGHNTGGGHDNLTAMIIETKIKSKLKSKMEKRIKVLLLVLGVICVLSILINIKQAVTNASIKHRIEMGKNIEKKVDKTTKTISIVHSTNNDKYKK